MNEQIRRKIQPLLEAYANVLVGNIDAEIAIPEDDNEFAELYAGTRILFDVIRRQMDELRQLNSQLEEKIALKTEELKNKNQLLVERNLRLEKFQSLTVGRELNMAELKMEINRLLEEAGRPPKYKTHKVKEKAAAT